MSYDGETSLFGLDAAAWDSDDGSISDGETSISASQIDASQQGPLNSTVKLTESSTAKKKAVVSRNLLKEFHCPICMDLFTDPVTAVCGHTFCHGCYHEARLHKPRCPLCRQRLMGARSINVVLKTAVDLVRATKSNVAGPSQAIDTHNPIGDNAVASASTPPRVNTTGSASIAEQATTDVDYNGRADTATLPRHLQSYSDARQLSEAANDFSTAASGGHANQPTAAVFPVTGEFMPVPGAVFQAKGCFTGTTAETISACRAAYLAADPIVVQWQENENSCCRRAHILCDILQFRTMASNEISLE